MRSKRALRLAQSPAFLVLYSGQSYDVSSSCRVCPSWTGLAVQRHCKTEVHGNAAFPFL